STGGSLALDPPPASGDRRVRPGEWCGGRRSLVRPAGEPGRSSPRQGAQRTQQVLPASESPAGSGGSADSQGSWISSGYWMSALRHEHGTLTPDGSSEAEDHLLKVPAPALQS